WKPRKRALIFAEAHISDSALKLRRRQGRWRGFARFNAMRLRTRRRRGRSRFAAYSDARIVPTEDRISQHSGGFDGRLSSRRLTPHHSQRRRRRQIHDLVFNDQWLIGGTAIFGAN